MRSRWIMVPLLALIAGGVVACDQAPIPKARGYLRDQFPPRNYVAAPDSLPFRCEIPSYASVRRATGARYAYNLQVDRHRMTLHLTYYDSVGALPTLMEESRRMVYDHTVRADGINERLFANANNRVWAMLYLLEGDVASNIQFYATDSVRHFLRGALYFYAIPNSDSIGPSVEFFRGDIEHLLETLEWR